MSSVDRSVERLKEIQNYSVSPFRCYYFNPKRYNTVQLMKWAQKYMANRMYMMLKEAARILEVEVVPGELLLKNAARDGYSSKMIRVGSLTFYLLKEEEMNKGLLERYSEFQKAMEEQS